MTSCVTIRDGGGEQGGKRREGKREGVAVNHDVDGGLPLWVCTMFLLSVSTLAGAMVIFTLAAMFLPDPPPPLDEDRCGFAFCEVCMKEAPYACSACKTTRYCSSVSSPPFLSQHYTHTTRRRHFSPLEGLS